MEQWNGQWPPQPYWGGGYNYVNQGYAQPATQPGPQQPAQQDSSSVGVARTDQTPPPARQDATPPPAAMAEVKGQGLHPPRIQQYSGEAGYTTELSAVGGGQAPVQGEQAPPPSEGALPAGQGTIFPTAGQPRPSLPVEDTVPDRPVEVQPPSMPGGPPGLQPPLQLHSEQPSGESSAEQLVRPAARKRRSRWEQPTGEPGVGWPCSVSCHCLTSAAASPVADRVGTGQEAGEPPQPQPAPPKKARAFFTSQKHSPQPPPAAPKKTKASPPHVTPEQWPPKLRSAAELCSRDCCYGNVHSFTPVCGWPAGTTLTEHLLPVRAGRRTWRQCSSSSRLS